MNKPLLSGLAAAAMLAGAPALAQQTFIAIGTGGVTGVYYPAGGAICRLVNRDRSEHGIRCGVESTGGSVFNLNALRSGELEFAVAQSDWQYHSFNGSSRFEEQGPDENLRSVFALHPEPFTVVARVDSGIESFEDLLGKRVNVGNPGSGTRGTMDVVMEAMGWSYDQFSVVSELPAGEHGSALCDNNIDAFVYPVGHPSGNIQEVTTGCDVRLIAVDGDAIQALVEERPYYRMATIPGGMYRGNDDDVVTFGVGATFVTSATVADEVAYHVTRAVFENLDTFRELHPALANLDPAEMVSDGLTAPLHDGTRAYLEEAGLID